MKIRFDPVADALYIRFDDAPVVESEEVSPGVVLDYDSAERVVGLEMLSVSRRIPAEQLRGIDFEIAEPTS